MSDALPSSGPTGGEEWISVGPAPIEVAQWQEARMKRIAPFILFGSAAMMSLVVAFVVYLEVPGVSSLRLGNLLGVLAGIVVVVGLASYAFDRWMLRWIATNSTLDVSRISILGRDLRIESARWNGSWPLARIWVSTEPIAADWFSVSLTSGRTNVTFYVPRAVATTISAAKSAEALPR